MDPAFHRASFDHMSSRKLNVRAKISCNCRFFWYVVLLVGGVLGRGVVVKTEKTVGGRGEWSLATVLEGCAAWNAGHSRSLIFLCALCFWGKQVGAAALRGMLGIAFQVEKYRESRDFNRKTKRK